MIKRLSDDQDDGRGVMLEHLKFEIIEQEQIPTEALERFEDFCLFLEVVGGVTKIPTVAQKLSFYFEIFQKFMESEVRDGPDGHNQRHGGPEVCDQVH